MGRFSDIPRGGAQSKGMSPFKAGAIAVVLIVLFTYFAFSKQNPFASPYELTALFDNSNRLAKRSPVRIAGVDVGKVVKIEPLEDGSGKAKVTMHIKDEGLPIKKDAELKIRHRLFLEGNYFVDLQPGRPSSPELPDGATVPANQTAAPVQFGQVLTTLQSETREDLRTFLKEYSLSLKREGAAGFNQAVKHWEDAYKNTSQVNDATLGQKRGHLKRVLDGQAKVFGALSKDEDALMELVTDLNQTVAAFAAQEDNLKAAIPRLRDVFREGRPALASLNEALPEIRGFARDALPGARSSSATLDAQIPFMKQARRLVAPAELGGLSKQLRVAVPDLTRLNRRSPRTLAQSRSLGRCQNRVLRPFAEAPIPDPDYPYHTGFSFSRESPKAFVGLAGESRLQDANSPYFRTQAGAGATTLLATGEAGEPLRGQLDFPLQGVRPARPNNLPKFRPDIPCETQEPPNLNAAGGPAGQMTTAKASSPLPRKSAKRQKARPEQYRRLREYADRTRKGLPAVDPFVWWGVGERMQLKRLGLKRDADGKLVKRGKK